MGQNGNVLRDWADASARVLQVAKAQPGLTDDQRGEMAYQMGRTVQRLARETFGEDAGAVIAARFAEGACPPAEELTTIGRTLDDDDDAEGEVIG